MSPFSKTEQDFINWLSGKGEDLHAAADALEEFLKSLLEENRVLYHLVKVRIKGIDSAIRKIRKKGYKNPSAEMSDILGARVFLFFRTDTDSAERAIRSGFDVDDARSVDKASILAAKEFGYTSRHLVCKVGASTADLRLKTKLGTMWFEIQIRTVLEHAWAEIEHEIVYKASTVVPDQVRRRFNASAAALEIIDREFDSLRMVETTIISDRIPLVHVSPDVEVDRAWLIASLMSIYPGQPSWNPKPSENVFYRDKELRIIESLRDAGCHSVAQLIGILVDERTPRICGTYWDLKGNIDRPNTHLLEILAACALQCQGIPQLLEDLYDVEMRTAVGQNL